MYYEDTIALARAEADALAAAGSAPGETIHATCTSFPGVHLSSLLRYRLSVVCCMEWVMICFPLDVEAAARRNRTSESSSTGKHDITFGMSQFSGVKVSSLGSVFIKHAVSSGFACALIVPS